MPRGRRLVPLVLFLSLLAAACGGDGKRTPSGDGSPGPEATFPVTLTDDEGVEVTLEQEPQSIVTFSPAHTEIVFALGLGERLVGVSGDFDDFPEEAAEIEQVGGAGEFGVEPNVERVVELEPDVLLTGFLGGEWKGRLRELGVPVFTTLAEGFDDAAADIETIGALVGAPGEAADLSGEMRDRAGAVEAAVAAEPRVSCFFEVSFEGGFFTVGPGAIELDLLERAGCDPVTDEADQPYPQWSVEQLVEDDPDVYLVSEDAGATAESVAARPGFGDLTATSEGRVVTVDADVITRPGPRLVQGLQALARALHPEAGV